MTYFSMPLSWVVSMTSGFYDKNKLGMVSDHQSLEGSRIQITDVEKLGFLNVNKLGAINDKMSGLGVIVY